MTAPSQGGGSPAELMKVRMLIRASLLGGVVMFGAVVYFQHHQGPFTPAPNPQELIYVPVIAIALALGGMFAVRPIWSRATGDAQRFSLALMGWAMGEGAALAGAVYYFLTDDPKFYIAGIFVLLASFMLFPIKRPE
jgi:hypothetical protein